MFLYLVNLSQKHKILKKNLNPFNAMFVMYTNQVVDDEYTT